MALNLITGLPGHGKSLYAISLMMKLVKKDNARPVYACNFTDLNHDVTQTINLEDAQTWHELPHGSIVFVDEAQTFFRQRPASVQPPDHCRALETHRHRGHDLYLVTQDATTLDAHVRKFVDVHYHLQRPFGYSYSRIFEYQGYSKRPGDRNEPTISKKKWVHNSDLYSLYKSATLHVVKKTFPLKLIASLSIFPILGYLIWSMFSWANSTFYSDEQTISDTQALESRSLSSNSLASSRLSRDKEISLESYVESRKPLVENVPWSSPFYIEHIKPKTYPKPHCIMNNSNGYCVCHSQQGTRMDINLSMCKRFVSKGFFDPTKNENEQVTRDGGRFIAAAPAVLQVPESDNLHGDNLPSTVESSNLRNEWNRRRW